MQASSCEHDIAIWHHVPSCQTTSRFKQLRTPAKLICFD